VLPALRLELVLLCAPGGQRARPVADRAARRRPRNRTALPRRHLDPRVGLGDTRRARTRDRLHAAARQQPGHHPHRRGHRGNRDDADGACDPARLRLTRPVVATCRRADPAGARRPRRPDAAHAHHAGAGRPAARGGVPGARGRAHPVRAHVVPVARRAAASGRRRAGADRHRDVLARVDRRLPLRRSVPRCGAQLAHRAEGAHVPPDRRHPRVADDVATRC